ncbi:MAG: class I SAM-dependent methyltransferase [Nitrospirae bacterium]|nr:class I SAM-dependent methyltransferase [Nitrospirota bacterium]MBF0553593.1 class I SAM-dependent methyltransferase [Nitrospirota bacterium]
MKEEEIRSQDALKQYLTLVEADVKDFFDFASFIFIPCPACSSWDFHHEFDKLGFNYVSCQRCHTLYVNPRPTFQTLRGFYSQAPSTTFWVNYFFKPVAEKRREKIFKPRAEYVAERLGRIQKWAIGDIGAGFGLFIEELRRLLPENDYYAIEPSIDMAEICRNKGVEVKCSCLEDVDAMEGTFHLLTSYELIEHLFDPVAFLNDVHRLLKPDGFFLFTTLNAKGFDIQMLWEKSKALSPPHHLNFLNPFSIRLLLDNLGFKDIEVTTPGKLDWDIVEGMIRNEKIDVGRFWQQLAYERSDTSKAEFQNWISRNDLSSHMMVLTRKG